MSYDSLLRLFSSKVPPWVLPAAVLLSAAAAGGVVAMAREIVVLRDDAAHLASENADLEERLAKLESARGGVRGFAIDYYGLDNLRLLQHAAPRRAVFYGDSITEFWDLPRYLPGSSYQLVNRGVKGQLTEHMLARLYFDVLQLRPEVVVLTAGTNDAVSLISEPRIEQNLDTMIYSAHRQGARVLVGTLPPVRLENTPQGPNPKAKEIAARADAVNAWIRRRCDGSLCTAVDFRKLMLAREKRTGQAALRDGLHPSPDGYSAMSDAVRGHLR